MGCFGRRNGNVINMPARQKMNKSGTQNILTGTPAIVTAWTSDGTYPATISANSLVIQGSGYYTARAYCSLVNGNVTFELRINGTTVATTSTSGTTIEYSGPPLSNNDTVSLYASTSSVGVIAAATYVEVEPFTGVKYQASSAGNRVTGTGNVSTTHTCATADANTIVVVGVVCSINSTGTYTPTVTYGGTSMTLWGTSETLDATTGVSVRLYYLLNPSTGAQTVTVTNAGTATRTSTMISSASYVGVEGVAQPYAGTTTNQTIGCFANEMMVGICSSSAAFSSFDGTNRYSGGGSVNGYGDYARLNDKVGTSTNSIHSGSSFTISATNPRLVVGRLVAAGQAAYAPFTDTFTSGINARWAGMEDANGAGTYGVTGGKMQASSGGGVIIYDATNCDARTSDVYVQASPVSASGYFVGLAWMVGAHATSALEVSYGTLQYYNGSDATSSVPITIGSYNAATDAWLRIASASGTTTLYTSANGSSWTSRASFTTPVSMANVSVAIYTITYDSTVWTDNFCILDTNTTNFFQMWP